MKNKYRQVADALLNQERILLFPHIKADGDAIGSTLALAMALENLGKSVSIISEEGVSESLFFLKEEWEMRRNRFREGFAVSVDCADLTRLKGRLFEDEEIQINIDHHRTNPGFGKLNLIEAAGSTGEILCELLAEMQVPFTEPIMRCLYVAIATDTNRFYYDSTTSDSLRWVAFFMDEGLDISALNHLLYGAVSLPRKKLQAKTLELAELDLDGRLIHVRLPLSVQKAQGTTDTDDLVEYLRDTKGVEVALFFYETATIWKASLRSKGNLDVSEIALVFGGGGHRGAAGVSFPKEKSEETMAALLEAVKEALRAR